MNIGDYIFLIIVCNFIGLIIAVFGPDASTSKGAFGMSNGFEFVNPVFIYKHNHVNWFGAVVVCLLYSLICPVGTVCYWFYKLCTVGRKVR